LYESVDNELYTHGVSNKDELCDVMRKAAAVGREKKECDLEPVTGFAKIRTAYKNVKLCFSMHTIAMCYDQNFVFLKLVLCGLKCKVLI
jgi:hypothetical protein